MRILFQRVPDETAATFPSTDGYSLSHLGKASTRRRKVVRAENAYGAWCK